jgi:hypothetical protein
MLILTLNLLYFFSVSAVVSPPLVAIGVHWARDGPKFVYMVDGCNALYIAKYNLVRHLQALHNVTMEPGKPRRPFI